MIAARRISFGLGAQLQATVCAALLLCLAHTPATAQTRFAQWQQLSGPMQRWTLLHPFAAPKALAISKRALAITDSVRTIGSIGTDANGGKLDAFRHGIWMALLVQAMSPCKAASLGRAYERGNHRDFRQGKLEDGAQQDAIASKMDLWNNKAGRRIGRTCEGLTDAETAREILRGLHQLEFRIVKKDRAGHCLDETDAVIPVEAWQGKWRNARCLWPSDWILDI
jgi:hypothetical protein